MLELPEVLNIASQLKRSVVGKRIFEVLPPTKVHKFCWFRGNVADYRKLICGSRIVDVRGFGLFVEIMFDNGKRLCFNDGVNVRLVNDDQIPKDFQLVIKVDSASSLVFTVAMYGGIVLHDGDYDNEYYLASENAISPFDTNFESHFRDTLAHIKPTLSVKAFLATEQRFPGIGNGILQDILYTARIHPKRKVCSLSEEEKIFLLHSITNVLERMTDLGGRDTEKDLYGNVCGYKTLLSKNTLATPCTRCGELIRKETYMGGTIYYCPECQKED